MGVIAQGRVGFPLIATLALLAAGFAAGPLHGAVAPVIDSFTVTPPSVAPGGTVTVSVAARDADCVSGSCTTGCGAYIRYDLTVWGATGGTYTAKNNGVSASPYSASASWQAPTVEGPYTLSVTLSDSGGMLCGGRKTVTASLTIQVSLVTNQPPAITSLTASPGQVFPGKTSALACSATDPDGDAVSYALATDFGSVTPGAGGTATFTAPAPGIATVTCSASDGRGGTGSSSIRIGISSARSERSVSGIFGTPQRVTIDSRGRAWVADRGEGAVVGVDLATGLSAGRVELNGVEAVAADWADNLLVAFKGRVEVRTTGGQVALTLEPGENLGAVGDVAVDFANRRYLALYRDSARVVVWDAAGMPVTEFGARGDGPADLRAPRGLAVTPAGQVVVADGGHALVKVFTAAGQHVFSTGGPGGGVGKFIQLDDVAVGSSGIIYASDSFQSWVQSFYPDGTPREVVGTYGDGAGRFKTPTGVAVADGLGRLVVTSLNSSRLEVFRVEAGGTTPLPRGLFSAERLDFAPQEAGVPSAGRTVQLLNAGTAPMSIGAPQVSGPFSQANDCGGMLLPSESCTVTVRSVPTEKGATTGSLAVDASAQAGGPFSVALAGSGFVRPTMTLSPTIVQFDQAEVGGQSAPRVVTLSNTSAEPLSLVDLVVDGPFAANTDCTETVPPASACTISLAFLPQAPGAALFGTLVVESNAVASPHVVQLLGQSVLPMPRLAIGDVTVDEGDGEAVTAVFPVNLSAPSQETVTIEYETQDGTALAGRDYDARAGRLTFAPGQTALQVSIPVHGDALLDVDERTFTVRLSNPVAAVLNRTGGTGTVLDDEVCPGPTLVANGGAERFPVYGKLASWSEQAGTSWQRRFAEPAPDAARGDGKAYFWPGETDAAELMQEIDVRPYGEKIRDGNQAFWFSGLVRTAGGDVARARVEYLDPYGVVLDSFDSGEVSSAAAWQTVEDARVVPGGTSFVRLRLLGRRVDADASLDAYFDAVTLRSLRAETISLAEESAWEGDAGQTGGTVRIRLACPSAFEVAGVVSTSDLTATALVDYEPTGAVVTFRPGETEQTVPVTIYSDIAEEAHEEIATRLQSAGGASVVHLVPTSRFWILNDDSCPKPVRDWARTTSLPVEWLLLGGVEYGPAAVPELLGRNGNDTPVAVAQELAAVRLNLAVGTKPAVLPLAAEADAWLAANPVGTSPAGAALNAGRDLARRLSDYNTAKCP